MADTFRQMVDAGMVEDPGSCTHGVPWGGDGCDECEIIRLKREVEELQEVLRLNESDFFSLKEAVKPFVDAFEEVRESNEVTDKHQWPKEEFQEFLDRNIITPGGTKMGDWRKLADVYKEIFGGDGE